MGIECKKRTAMDFSSLLKCHTIIAVTTDCLVCNFELLKWSGRCYSLKMLITISNLCSLHISILYHLFRIRKKQPIMTKVLFFICLCCLGSQVSSRDTLNPGDRLDSSSSLISSKMIFTLGFYTPYESNNVYMAIQYTQNLIYPVWIGNRESAISNDSDPVLTIDSTGKLIITHGGGETIEVFAGGSGKNATAILLDSGNFIVKDMNSSSEILWQSFDHPTDTLLPGMKLGINHTTGRNRKLTSWLGGNNPAAGAFTLEWDPISGRLVNRWRGMVRWTSGRMKDYYIQSSNFQVEEFENFNIQPNPVTFNYNFTSVTTYDGEYFMFSLLIDPKLTPEYKRMISGWKLEYDGVISDVGNGMLTKIATTSNCYGYSNQGPDKGCKFWEQPKCRNHRPKFVLESGIFLTANGLVASSTYDENSNLSLSDCRESCWKDCACAGYDDTSTSGGCRYWKGKNLKFEPRLDGSVPRKYVLNSSPSGKNYLKIIFPVISIPATVVLGIGLFIWRRFKQGRVIRKRNEELKELLTLEGYMENDDIENGGAESHDLRPFTYAFMQSATDNFSLNNKLGEGGFGPVYKGKTADGGKDIAVKVLSQGSGQGLLEFKTELILISKLQHVNLVKLLGYCIHGNDKMIIYEYMPNKSLDFFLFDPSMRKQLDWQLRFNIIEGIAQGLLYLHKYSRLKIVHRDLKPSNILLDENMNPKISDFGLARIFKQNINEAKTEKCAGTFGYMAPEYAMQGIFSVKSDVYSFGVLVLEVVSGCKSSSYLLTEGPLNLVEHAWELWKTDSAVQLMDPSLGATCVTNQLIRCIQVALLCVENHGTNRPTIEDVLEMLKNDATNLPKPQNPAFITSVRDEVVRVENSKPVKEMASTNQDSVSELAGR